MLFIVPGIIFAGLFLLVNYFAILEEKNINESILLSWNKARENFINYLLMAAFFWFITILSISMVSYISSSFQGIENIPIIVSIFSSSLAIYIQACLISFPIVIADMNVKLSIVDIRTDRIDITKIPYNIGEF